jgi:hypothetical protein
MRKDSTIFSKRIKITKYDKRGIFYFKFSHITKTKDVFLLCFFYDLFPDTKPQINYRELKLFYKIFL